MTRNRKTTALTSAKEHGVYRTYWDSFYLVRDRGPGYENAQRPLEDAEQAIRDMPIEERYLLRVADALDEALFSLDLPSVKLDLPHMKDQDISAIAEEIENHAKNLRHLAAKLREPRQQKAG